MISKLTRLLIPAAFTIGVFGCNSGGDGSQVAGGGIGGTGAPTGVSFGAITEQGSIFVNGVEFSTSTATPVDRDGVPVDVAVLQPGMTVEVHGSIDSSTKGTAQDVFIDEAVRGQVESVNPAENSFVVLGQNVLVDENTKFDKFDASLQSGFQAIQDIFNNGTNEIVEVHGLVKNYGTVSATFIQKSPMNPQPPVTRYSVRGFVENHAPNMMGGGGTFNIGPLTVNYDDTTEIAGGLPASWTNLYLDIKGDACNGMPVCGTMHARVIDFEGFPTDETIPDAEMEGFVREVTPPASDGSQQFTVAGQKVLVVPGSTVFVDGMQSDMVIGARVEVEGSLNGPILTATRIIFKDVSFESDATVSGSTLTLAGFTGITIQTDTQTQFRGGATKLSDVNLQHVRVRGREDANNSIVATEIELRSPSNKVFIKGVPKVVSSTTFKILSISIDTTGLGDGSFKDTNDVQIGRTEFFTVLSAGEHLVKAQGTLSSGSITFDEIELEE